MIYPGCNNLTMLRNGQAPAVVLPPALDEELGLDIIEMYKALNVNVTLSNQDTFKNKDKTYHDLGKLQHLCLHWGGWFLYVIRSLRLNQYNTC